jgi:hypothetical protein
MAGPSPYLEQAELDGLGCVSKKTVWLADLEERAWPMNHNLSPSRWTHADEG